MNRLKKVGYALLVCFAVMSTVCSAMKRVPGTQAFAPSFQGVFIGEKKSDGLGLFFSVDDLSGSSGFFPRQPNEDYREGDKYVTFSLPIAKDRFTRVRFFVSPISGKSGRYFAFLTFAGFDD